MGACARSRVCVFVRSFVRCSQIGFAQCGGDGSGGGGGCVEFKYSECSPAPECGQTPGVAQLAVSLVLCPEFG